MKQEGEKIGILGGTFDPVHYGHLIIAQSVRDEFGLDRILFIPSGMPPHKNTSMITGAEHRINMLLKAVEESSYFEVSRIEADREGYTYTVDTLKQLRGIYGDDANLFFIVGADVIMDLLTWRKYEEVFKMCEFIAVLRPDFGKDEFSNKIEYLKTSCRAKIHVVDIPLIGISSTAIRERVKKNESIEHLVPSGVETYIAQNGLYAEVITL